MTSSSNAQDHRFEASYDPSPLVSQDVVYSIFFTWKAALNVGYVLFSTAFSDSMIVLVAGASQLVQGPLQAVSYRGVQVCCWPAAVRGVPRVLPHGAYSLLCNLE